MHMRWGELLDDGNASSHQGLPLSESPKRWVRFGYMVQRRRRLLDPSIRQEPGVDADPGKNHTNGENNPVSRLG
jgi:hypothetical protein